MSTEARASPDLDGAARLDDWGLLKVDGEDAVTFLQGQLTQDLLGLGAADARLAGYCSPKGRLLATFVAWRDGSGAVWLATSADVVAVTVKRLSMYVLRARCRVADATLQRGLWGLAGSAVGAAADDTAGLAVWGRRAVEGGDLIRLPDGVAAGVAVPRALFVAHTAAGVAKSNDADGAGQPLAAPPLTVERWRWLEASSGVPRVTAATSEHFVPQMVNLELVGGVDFQKGCYPGQEVVARSQYRGVVKRRAAVVAADVALRPGAEVFHSDDPAQPAGEVILSGSRSATDHLALIEIRRSALEGGTLHAGGADGPALRPQPLPYAMPALRES